MSSILLLFTRLTEIANTGELKTDSEIGIADIL